MTIPIGKYMHAEPLLCDPHDIYTIHARDKSILGHAEMNKIEVLGLYVPDLCGASE